MQGIPSTSQQSDSLQHDQAKQEEGPERSSQASSAGQDRLPPILFDGEVSESENQYGKDIITAAVSSTGVHSLICHGALVGLTDSSRPSALLGRGIFVIYAWIAAEVLAASPEHRDKPCVHYLLRTSRPSNNILDLDNREWPLETTGVGIVFVSNGDIIREIVRVTDAIIDMYNTEVSVRVRAMLEVVLSVALIPGGDTFTKTHLAFVVFNVSKLFDMIEGEDIARFVEACAVGCVKLNDARLSTALYVAMRMGTRQGSDLLDFSTQPGLLPYLAADRDLSDPKASESREQIYLAYMAQKTGEEEELGLWSASLFDSVEVWGHLVPSGHDLELELEHVPEPLVPPLVLHRAICPEKILGAQSVKRPFRMKNGWKLLPPDVEPLDVRGIQGRLRVIVGGRRNAALVFLPGGKLRLTFKDARNYTLNILSFLRLTHVMSTQIREDVIDANSVHDRAVIYMMLQGELDMKGTRAVLQHILFGDVTISTQSKNSLMRAIGVENGWRIDGSVSPRIFHVIPVACDKNGKDLFLLLGERKLRIVRHGAKWICDAEFASDGVKLSSYGLLETGANIGRAS